MTANPPINVRFMREGLLDSLQHVGKAGVPQGLSAYVTDMGRLLDEYEQAKGSMTEYDFSKRQDALRKKYGIPT